MTAPVASGPGPSSGPVPPSGPVPSSGLAIVAELARRFAAGDGAGAAALFHPEIRVQQPGTLPHGGWHSGAAGLAGMGAAFGRHWTRTITDPRISGGGDDTGDASGDDDIGDGASGDDASGDGASGDGASDGNGGTVTQVTTQTWTAKATGRSATVDVVELFEFRDGLVSQIRVFQQDTALLLRTLSSETQSSEILPSETLSSETQSSETQSPETLPSQTLPSETQSPETPPSETLSSETLPPETQSSETLPSETPPSERPA